MSYAKIIYSVNHHLHKGIVLETVPTLEEFSIYQSQFYLLPADCKDEHKYNIQYLSNHIPQAL